MAIAFCLLVSCIIMSIVSSDKLKPCPTKTAEDDRKACYIPCELKKDLCANYHRLDDVIPSSYTKGDDDCYQVEGGSALHFCTQSMELDLVLYEPQKSSTWSSVKAVASSSKDAESDHTAWENAKLKGNEDAMIELLCKRSPGYLKDQKEFEPKFQGIFKGLTKSDQFAIWAYTSQTAFCTDYRASLRISSDGIRRLTYWWFDDKMQDAFKHHHHAFLNHVESKSVSKAESKSVSKENTDPPKYVFHGTSGVCIDLYKAVKDETTFYGPLSTSEDKKVAIKFAGSGDTSYVFTLKPVYTIDSEYYPPVEINSIPGISSYTEENEWLFYDQKFRIVQVVVPNSIDTNAWWMPIVPPHTKIGKILKKMETCTTRLDKIGAKESSELTEDDKKKQRNCCILLFGGSKCCKKFSGVKTNAAQKEYDAVLDAYEVMPHRKKGYSSQINDEVIVGYDFGLSLFVMCAFAVLITIYTKCGCAICGFVVSYHFFNKYDDYDVKNINLV